LIVADLGLRSGSVVATLPTVVNLHTITFAFVPEPAQATAIAGLALLGFGLLRRRSGGMSCRAFFSSRENVDRHAVH